MWPWWQVRRGGRLCCLRGVCTCAAAAAAAPVARQPALHLTGHLVRNLLSPCPGIFGMNLAPYPSSQAYLVGAITVMSVSAELCGLQYRLD